MVVDADESAMIEIDENLARAELSALDRALFIAARKALHERLNPAARHGGDRKSGKYHKSNRGQVPNVSTRSFTATTAKRTGRFRKHGSPRRHDREAPDASTRRHARRHPARRARRGPLPALAPAPRPRSVKSPNN